MAGARFLAALMVMVLLPSCRMFDVDEQQARFDAACRIEGHVEAERDVAAPLVVVLGRQIGADPMQAASWELADHYVLDGPGSWQFQVSPGRYGLVAFQDLNRDLKHQPSEPYLRFDAGRTLSCTTGALHDGIALRVPAAGRARQGDTLDVSALQVRTLSEQIDLSMSQVTALGERAALSDARFAPAIAEDGLWRPFDFLFHGRPGVYFLEPFDARRTPVLFVHGINGTPRNFSRLIERLDHKRFQAWVYYYPSGFALAGVADHLTQTMRKLQLRYGFRSFAVIAHSMGGLVSRGFLQRYPEQGAARIPLFVSVSTPWGGHRAAEIGVKTAPEVVRVWIDLAPESEYLRSLYARDPGVPHYLFYSYTGEDPKQGSDGTVSVASELQPQIRRGAAQVEGLRETHMGILDSARLAGEINGLLARMEPR